MFNSHLIESLLTFTPLVIVALTALVVMIAIAMKRSHFWSATLSVLGLNFALISLVAQALGLLPIGQVSHLFVIDGFALFNMAVILIASLACCTLAYGYFQTLKDNKDELYLLMLISTIGAMLMVSATDLTSFFMSLELLSVPMYGMLAYTFLRARSLESGLKYLVLSATASATLLMGMAFIFADTGALSFKALGVSLTEGTVGVWFALGVVMMMVSIAFKLSAAPLHSWVSDVYEGAPAPIAAFLASVSKVAMMALAIRFLMTSMIPSLAVFDAILMFIIAASILMGNLLAIRQHNLKRLLAYSSVAHIGYALVALLSVQGNSIGVVSVYMAIYALTSIGAFGVITLMSSPYKERGRTSISGEADELRFYQGLFWRRPVLTVVLTIMLLSLAGIPLTAGFMTKVMIILSSVQGVRFWAALLVILGSAIGLAYYLRVLTQLYQRPKVHLEYDAHHEWGIKAGGVMLLIVTAMIIVLGIFPDTLFRLANLAI
ncbi:NADH-quinone oxidoreductase subunit N [Moraxella haemolytica]|uniref:NADH-quinone oxidoreductase subunit N n=1 Tax=Moraxella haemolytica TaxID=2904119 RepID=UPI002542C624|nr:NADH-quinone oxidoreductase subunit N [Moraxella sp. ZY171148]WII94649.1 NADH-quinone oxidoreductase subunit N [Moraxella sp. ZY171148]